MYTKLVFGQVWAVDPHPYTATKVFLLLISGLPLFGPSNLLQAWLDTINCGAVGSTWLELLLHSVFDRCGSCSTPSIVNLRLTLFSVLDS